VRDRAGRGRGRGRRAGADRWRERCSRRRPDSARPGRPGVAAARAATAVWGMRVLLGGDGGCRQPAAARRPPCAGCRSFPCGGRRVEVGSPRQAAPVVTSAWSAPGAFSVAVAGAGSAAVARRGARSRAAARDGPGRIGGPGLRDRISTSLTQSNMGKCLETRTFLYKIRMLFHDPSQEEGLPEEGVPGHPHMHPGRDLVHEPTEATALLACRFGVTGRNCGHRLT
jgi:hypothetical protein